MGERYYEEGKLYFHHTTENSWFESNISGEVTACFTIVGETELLPSEFSTRYESVIAFGMIRESSDKIAGLMKLVKRLGSDYFEKGQKYAEAVDGQVVVYEFKIERTTGKARKER